MPPLISEPYFRCLEHFERGLKAFFDRFSDWVGPALVFGGISLVAGACCCLPGVLLQGPLSCGLFACALAAIRGLPFTDAFRASWRVSGKRFWDLWALHLLGSLVVTMCSHLCAPLGLLLGVPLYHCMVASAFEERFSRGMVEG